MINRIILITLLSVFLPSHIFAQNINQSQIDNVMNQINSKRIELGYNSLEIDNNLCLLAQKIADDSERNYPNEINQSLNTSTEYKDYLEEYSTYKTTKMTISDVLVEAVGQNKASLKFSDDQLVASFTNTDSPLSGAAMTPELNSGCIGVSSNEIGYKPFAYFVGGIKKDVMIPTENNMPGQSLFQMIWNTILSFFSK